MNVKEKLEALRLRAGSMMRERKERAAEKRAEKAARSHNDHHGRFFLLTVPAAATILAAVTEWYWAILFCIEATGAIDPAIDPFSVQLTGRALLYGLVRMEQEGQLAPGRALHILAGILRGLWRRGDPDDLAAIEAIADEIVTRLRAEGVRPLGVEGVAQGQWALLDFGDFLVHVFTEDRRRFYQLERLWSDAPDVTASFGG